MADPVYKRVSTDQQSTNRQNLVLAEAGTSSRLHPRTGELLSTVKFIVQTHAATGELHRGLQRELT
ncbi:hypothetical protein ACWCQB_16740 [Streptomyces hirsutus]